MYIINSTTQKIEEMRNIKQILRLLSLLCLAIVIAAPDCEAKGKRLGRQRANKYDIYLMIGQSNMAGRGRLLAADTLKNIEGVWLLNDKDKPEPARNPLNKYSSIRKKYGMQQMSPGYGFATKVHNKTGRKILLVHNARGGTSISWWLPDSDHANPNYYSEAVRRTRKAMKYGTLRAILWHQGCADSGKALPQYMGRLKTLVENLRRDLKAKDVPFIAGELAYWRKSSVKFNKTIRTISEHIPNSDYVSAEGCGMLKNEKDPHFSREGEVLLGERYADKVLALVYGISTAK